MSEDRSHAFNDGPDEFAIPEEPIIEETANVFHNEQDRASQGVSETIEADVEILDTRPWYKKPSPWWMLVLMPITAMSMAGVSPSLLAIYTELVCRDVQRTNITSYYEGVPNYHVVPATYNQTHPLYIYPQADAYDATKIISTSSWQNVAPYVVEPEDCSSNPQVQKTVSKLMATISSTMGTLSVITAASWSSLSDRIGRRRILLVASSAVVIMYMNKVLVWNYSDSLPGGYWFFLFGTTIFGLLGGSAVSSATVYAYIVDCMEPASRSRTLSLALGLRFTGMAIGPTICAIIVRLTGTPISSVIFVVVVHVIHILVVFFLLPESLSKEKILENRRAWSGSRAREVGTNRRSTLQSAVTGALAFLKPLTILRPSLVVSEGREHRDWSLSFIAISSGLASMILASYATMFQYSMNVYKWTAVELGYWFSAVTGARALTLTVILPVLIKILYPYWKSRNLPIDEAQSSETTALLSSSRSNSPDPTNVPPPSDTKPPRHSPAFDLAIAQASLLLEVVCYGLVPVLAHVRWNEPIYAFLTVFASCGAGFGPAIQALAVDIYTRHRDASEIGRLFGVLGVVQAVSSQIVGPTVYGFSYVKLVDAGYPVGIFFVSATAVGLACFALFLVELPSSKKTKIGPESEVV